MIQNLDIEKSNDENSEMDIYQKVEKYKSDFQSLNKESLFLLDEMYDPHITFRDPLHTIHGLERLKIYFGKMYGNVGDIKFTFTDDFIKDDSAVLMWQMEFIHRKINKGRVVMVDGSSHIKFNQRCYYHRDYFDAGEMLYENLPILRGIIRAIKKRVKA